MGTDAPLLRVVMPVHNAGPFLAPAVDTALAALDQLPEPAELVIVDDGSTDGSQAWLVAKAASDDRVQLLTNETTQGPARAMNAGIQHGAPAAFVAVAEHDDVTLPTRFVEQIAFLREHPRVGAVAGEGRYLGPSGRVMGHIAVGPRTLPEFETARASLEPILIPHPAATFRTEALDACGLYDPEFDGAHDLELFNRIVYSGGWAVITMPSTHVHYRVHPGATSFSLMGSQRMMTRYIAARNECVARGVAAPPYRAWVESATDNRRDRIRWARKDRGALLYRRAGLAWIGQQRARAVMLGAAATALHPKWVLLKVRNQARGRVAR